MITTMTPTKVLEEPDSVKQGLITRRTGISLMFLTNNAYNSTM